MNGLSTMPSNIHPSSSNKDAVDSLRSELMSGDEHRARVAAAFIRSSYDVRNQYRSAGVQLAIMVDGEIRSVDPDSPILPDLSELVPLVKAMFPLPPEREPEGFLAPGP